MCFLHPYVQIVSQDMIKRVNNSNDYSFLPTESFLGKKLFNYKTSNLNLFNIAQTIKFDHSMWNFKENNDSNLYSRHKLDSKVKSMSPKRIESNIDSQPRKNKKIGIALPK